MRAEDERTGRLLRAIRRRSGATQEALARAAAVPVRDVIAIEAGRVGSVEFDRVRRLLRALDGRARLDVWWNGASADRLLDERHAALVERVVRVFRARGWESLVEVSYAEYGERGSIDILGLNQRHAAAVACEVKSEIGSLEEANRRLDVKVRLLPKIAFDRAGWRPRHLGRLLILPEDSTARRVVAQHAKTMSELYPARSREVRAWLRSPERPIRGLWFLSELPNSTGIRR